MKTVNALQIRNNLGKVLQELEETGEPILLSKGRKVRAARPSGRHPFEPGYPARAARLPRLRYVIDASVALRWYVQEERSDSAEAPAG